ncbi:hypothetical protein EVAR_22680_1 [Eumeta japonica]|uniref:Uncharacterized protein n=1 Tax=Eumeta variegata TaxID=151549 RepID=A0A4C1VKY6_EUMVA|nr:hypothetical protein EVAR_22680_1 [Eumeta japonica]
MDLMVMRTKCVVTSTQQSPPGDQDARTPQPTSRSKLKQKRSQCGAPAAVGCLRDVSTRDIDTPLDAQP